MKTPAYLQTDLGALAGAPDRLSAAMTMAIMTITMTTTTRARGGSG
jgi:hypothetical protein